MQHTRALIVVVAAVALTACKAVPKKPETDEPLSHCTAQEVEAAQGPNALRDLIAQCRHADGRLLANAQFKLDMLPLPAVPRVRLAAPSAVGQPRTVVYEAIIRLQPAMAYPSDADLATLRALVIQLDGAQAIEHLEIIGPGDVIDVAGRPGWRLGVGGIRHVWSYLQQAGMADAAVQLVASSSEDATVRIRVRAQRLDTLPDARPTPPATASKPSTSHGTLWLRLWVEADGVAKRGEVLQSSGHDALDRKAIESMVGRKVGARTVNGVAQPMWIRVPMTFAVPS